nr:hypothetical protein CcurKRNrm3_p057 [Cryptomonas curvata]
MRFKNFIFFLKLKKNTLIKIKTQKKILYYYHDIYFIQIILTVILFKLNIKLQSISKKTICNYRKSKLKKITIVSNDYITIKDLNVLLFLQFLGGFRIFSLFKKVPKKYFKKFNRKFRVYFNRIL